MRALFWRFALFFFFFILKHWYKQPNVEHQFDVRWRKEQSQQNNNSNNETSTHTHTPKKELIIKHLINQKKIELISSFCCADDVHFKLEHLENDSNLSSADNGFWPLPSRCTLCWIVIKADSKWSERRNMTAINVHQSILYGRIKAKRWKIQLDMGQKFWNIKHWCQLHYVFC